MSLHRAPRAGGRLARGPFVRWGVPPRPHATPARRGRWLGGLALAGVLGALALARAAPPHTPEQARRQIERAEQARAAALAAHAAAAARAAAAAARAAQLIAARHDAEARLRAAQAATAVAGARLAALDQARQHAAARLEAATRALTPLLPLLERLSLYPAETLLAAPVPPEQAVRGTLVLRGLTHELAARAAQVTAEQARLAAARQALADAAPALEAAEATQAAAQAALDRQIAAANSDRLSASTAAQDAADRAAQLSARARSLRDLLTRLKTARRKAAREEAARHAAPTAGAEPTPSGPIRLAARTKPDHQLLRPVAGPIIRSWGDHTPAGPATGLSWRARPGARVIAPCTGRVLFAAPFRGYGQLLILDCGGGYDAVIAGFAQLDAAMDAVVRAGQIVGTLPDADHRPKLYLELRHNGVAIDPTPWLHASA